MKKIIITLAVAAMAMFSANAEEKTKAYDFGDITGIDANFLYTVHVTEGKSDKVTLVYDDMIETFLDLEVSYKPGSAEVSPRRYPLYRAGNGLPDRRLCP